MVHPIHVSPSLVQPAALEAATHPPRAAVADAAVALAALAGGPATAGAICERPTADRRALEHAVLSAVSGSPDALVAYLTIQIRNSQAAGQSRVASAAGQAAHDAELQRQDATKKAEAAAQSATGFLGLGDTLGWVVKIATMVVAACAAVATGGVASGLLVAAGAVLLTCGDNIAQEFGKAGVIPQDAVEHVAAAIKLTGAIMMGGGVLGVVAGVASVVLTTYAKDIAHGLADAGVIGRNDVDTMQMGLSIAGAVAGLAGAAAGIVDGAAAAGNAASSSVDAGVATATRALETVGRDVQVTSTVLQTGCEVGAAVENHDAADANADAKLAGSRADTQRANQSEAIDSVRDIVKGIARLMGRLRDIEEARATAQRAAAQGRA